MERRRTGDELDDELLSSDNQRAEEESEQNLRQKRSLHRSDHSFDGKARAGRFESYVADGSKSVVASIIHLSMQDERLEGDERDERPGREDEVFVKSSDHLRPGAVTSDDHSDSVPPERSSKRI
jgi:hypothetical protein